MTKQDFLNGKSFHLKGDWNKTTTYKYGNEGVASGNKLSLGGIVREYRMTNDIDKVLISDHIMNIEKVGSKKIHLYTFLLGKKITDKIRYEDMEEYIKLEERID